MTGLVNCDPSSAGAHNNLGIALKGLDRLAEAAQQFERANALDPTRPEMSYNLGQALQALGRSREARAWYERAIALRPDYAEAHNSLGVMLGPQYPKRRCYRLGARSRSGRASRTPITTSATYCRISDATRRQ